MVYSVKKNLRLASCNDDIVILDLLTDQFHILNDLPAERLNVALRGEDVTLAEALEDRDLIEQSEVYTPIEAHRTNGFFEQRWMTPIVDATCSWLDKLSAASAVTRANQRLKRATMHGILDEIGQNPPLSPLACHGDASARLMSLMAALNVAFSLDRTRNQCLAYSYSLTWLARRSGIPASLVVGIRTRPFLSHAWVEYENKVVNDDSRLREKLSVIAVA